MFQPELRRYASKSQFWRKGSDKWEEGPAPPHPEGTFLGSCVAKIDEDNLLLMGGRPGKKYGKKVFKYNVPDKTWTPMPDMKIAWEDPACVLFKDESASYVLVAGGYTTAYSLASTEMYFLNGTVKESKPMKKKRAFFQIMFMDTPTPRVYAIGGFDVTLQEYHGSIEMWDNSKTWKMTNIKMKTPRRDFGAVFIPKSMMPEIDCQDWII